MNSTCLNHSQNEKFHEYFGWIGNCIFIGAQLFQITHTYRTKKTEDLSYGLEILWLIGNCMYTTFGILDRSMSMFFGNLITLITSLIQLLQKIYYDNKNKRLSGYIEIN